MAADGGLLRLQSLGLTPDAVYGDFDSADPPAGIPFEVFTREKDEADGEIAFAKAVNSHISEVLLVGAFGGRFDMALGHVALLRQAEAMGVRASLTDGRQEAFLASRSGTPLGPIRTRVSVLPLTPGATLASHGLKWPLDGLTLSWDRMQGVSNIVTAPSAWVRLLEGEALVVTSLRKATT